ncbi:MAG: MFS transporter [Planctomycetes bacterium]|nr:MFS transporter [Planctomycetota bacterium]
MALDIALPKSTKVRYQVLAAGCTLAVLTYVFRLGFTSAMAAIKRDLHLDNEQVGYLAAAFLVPYALFQVPGGLLGDRLGGRHLLTILVVGWSVLTAAVALVVLLPVDTIWPFALLLLLRFLFGMFQAGGFPVWARVIADWIPLSERGAAQGTVWTFSRLGGALSPFLILGLFWLFGVWTMPFLALAGLGILWCVLFWPWFRNKPEEMPQVNEAELALIAAGRMPATAAVGAEPVPWKKMLASPSVWGLSMQYAFGGFAGNFVTSWLPAYLEEHRGLSPAATSVIFGLTLTAGLVSCLAGGMLSDWLIRRTGNRKWGRRLIGLVGFACAGLASLAVPWAGAAWIVGALFCVSFFFNDINMGPAWASCADVGERHAGTLSGTMNMMGSLVGAASMTLAGYLLERDAEKLLFILFACSYGIAALSWLLVDVTKPLAPRSDPPLAA